MMFLKFLNVQIITLTHILSEITITTYADKFKPSLSYVPTKASRIEGAYFGSLVADALTLGSHYEYDAKVIKKAYGGKIIDGYLAPGEKMGGETHGVGWGRRNYHPGQKRGDNTDYGMYVELILKFLDRENVYGGGKEKDIAKNTARPAGSRLMRNKDVDLNGLVPYWRDIMEDKKKEGLWGAWKCTQTKQALQKLQRYENDYTRLGGNSNAMSVRSPALLAAIDDEKMMAKNARTVMFTHANEEALLGGEFFARVAFKLVHHRVKDKGEIDKESNPGGALADMLGNKIFGSSDDDEEGNGGTSSGLIGGDITKSSNAEIINNQNLVKKHGNRLTPRKAIEMVRDEMKNAFINKQVQKGIDKYEEVMDPLRPLGFEEYVDDLAMTSMARLWDVGKTEPIKVGKASPTEGTMPSSIYIILKYSENYRNPQENSFVAGVRANAMVGGDSASRAVAIGSVLGAYYGVEGIYDKDFGGEEHFKSGLNAWKRSEKKLRDLPVLRKLYLNEGGDGLGTATNYGSSKAKAGKKKSSRKTEL